MELQRQHIVCHLSEATTTTTTTTLKTTLKVCKAYFEFWAVEVEFRSAKCSLIALIYAYAGIYGPKNHMAKTKDLRHELAVCRLKQCAVL